MRSATMLAFAASLALVPIVPAQTHLDLENGAGGAIHHRLQVDGETARVELVASPAEGFSRLAAGDMVRVEAPATRWDVSLAGVVRAGFSAEDGPVRVRLGCREVQGVSFVEFVVEREAAVLARHLVFLRVDEDELVEKKARLEEEVERRELELEIARLEGRLRWIDCEVAHLYLPPPGTWPYRGAGPVYSFTAGYFGFPFPYGRGFRGGHGFHRGGLDFGFRYRGDDFFLGFGTHHH